MTTEGAGRAPAMRYPGPMQLDPLPPQCRVDEPLAIRVRGLSPGERVVLTLGSRFGGAMWLSRASFHADAAGAVDVAKQSPIEGGYEGVDATGLLWSRAPIDEIDVGVRGSLSDDPMTATLIAEAPAQGARIVQAIRRVYVDADVVMRRVEQDSLTGKLFEHRDGVPRPGVLVVGGSGGGLGWAEEMAALLSAHGYTTLALAYFAMPGLPATLDRIPLEYFGSALQWFAGQPSVQGQHLGVVGASRGGELALLLGANFGQLRCVVAYVPSGVAWDAYPSSGHSAWTLAGKELAHAAPDEAQWDAAVAEGQADPKGHGWYRFALQESAVRERASIPVEQIQGPVLLISGVDDGLWPSTELADLAVQRARREKFAHRMEHLAYSEAGHGIGWPGGPTTVTRFVHPVSGEELDSGGTPAGNARARRDSWKRALDFLAEALPGPGA